MILFSVFDPSSISIKASLFENLSNNGNGGALNLNAYQNINISIIHDVFVNNKAIGTYFQGGAIYYFNVICNKFHVQCTIFDKNNAYHSCAFCISNRNNPIPLDIFNTVETNEYANGEYNHLSILGGNPLHYRENNITNNNVPHHGLVIDYAQKEENDTASYINFMCNTLQNGYFVFDQQKMPNNIYYDNWNFINNSIPIFYGKGCLDKKQAFFNSNFIFNDEYIPTFSFLVNFHSCYFSHDISEYSNVKINGINAAVSYEIYIDFNCILHINKITLKPNILNNMFYHCNVFVWLYLISK